jgi:hypothetical protein
MFAVNLALGNTVWRLLFKDEEKAKFVFNELKPQPLATKTVRAEDDFGQICEVTVESVHGLMFEDLDRSKLANVELYLHQKRTEHMAMKSAQSDPGLRASSMMNGPQVLSPMGGMPRN